MKMKYKCLTFLLILVLPLLIGCATTKPYHCPPEEMIVRDPYTGLPLSIEKGFFDEDNHHKGWITKKEFEKALEEEMKEYKEKQKR